MNANEMQSNISRVDATIEINSMKLNNFGYVTRGLTDFVQTMQQTSGRIASDAFKNRI
jgi:hypothetical protein